MGQKPQRRRQREQEQRRPSSSANIKFRTGVYWALESLDGKMVFHVSGCRKTWYQGSGFNKRVFEFKRWIEELVRHQWRQYPDMEWMTFWLLRLFTFFLDHDGCIDISTVLSPNEGHISRSLSLSISIYLSVTASTVIYKRTLLH